MIQEIFCSIKLTLLSIIVFVFGYALLLEGIAKLMPGNGLGETVKVGNKVVGYDLEGQNFTEDKYFNGRASACGYNATSGSGSNKGPSNPDYLKDVKARIDTFMVHNPMVKKEDIPSELVTSSASGLDPDLSPKAAYIQVNRIARARNISAERINELIAAHIQKPLLTLFGPEKVNVLQLNIALDQLK